MSCGDEAVQDGSFSFNNDQPTRLTNGHKFHVKVNFGGANDSWCSKLNDFTAVAPLQLSCDIESVVLIGHRGNAK